MEQLIDCFDIEKLRKKAQNEKKRKKRNLTSGTASAQQNYLAIMINLGVEWKKDCKGEQFNPEKGGGVSD